MVKISPKNDYELLTQDETWRPHPLSVLKTALLLNHRDDLERSSCILSIVHHIAISWVTNDQFISNSCHSCPIVWREAHHHDVQPTGNHVGGDQHPRHGLAEGLDDHVALVVWHFRLCGGGVRAGVQLRMDNGCQRLGTPRNVEALSRNKFQPMVESG